MPTHKIQQIKRNDVVTAKEIEDLRAAVGWERLENKYDKILANSYAHFTLRERSHLLCVAGWEGCREKT